MGDKAAIQVYVTSVSSSSEVKHRQQHIKMLLESKKIPFEEVDISCSHDLLDKMREIAGNPKCLPPQIARGDEYIGGYEEFNEAVEREEVKEFLKM